MSNVLEIAPAVNPAPVADDIARERDARDLFDSEEYQPTDADYRELNEFYDALELADRDWLAAENRYSDEDAPDFHAMATVSEADYQNASQWPEWTDATRYTLSR